MSEIKENGKIPRASWRRAGSQTLAEARPELIAQWHPTLNSPLTPETVTSQSSFKAEWLCEPYGHPWAATVSNRTIGTGCPTCAGKIILIGFNDLASRRPDVVAEWDYEANGALLPTMVTEKANQFAHWRCLAHGHPWIAKIANRCNGRGCPFCARKQVLAGFNDLGTTHPEYAEEWHPFLNGALRACHVMAGTQRKVWWRCKALGHRFQSAVGSRISDGIVCPVCYGRTTLAGYNDILTTHPDVAAEMVSAANGDTLYPTQVSMGSKRKVLWRCRAQGHEWEATVASRCAQGSGCPDCWKGGTSTPELAHFEALKPFLSSAINGDEIPLVWGQKSTSANVDITGVLAGHRIAIEYDGIYYHDRPAALERDLRKTRALLAAGWLVVRIREAAKFRSLTKLPLADKGLLQISQRYSIDPAAAMDYAEDSAAAIVRWVADLR